MGTLLSTLTPRGRALLAVGLGISVVALIIGERDLLRLGVFTALLPLLGLPAVLRSPDRVRHERALEPPRVPLGQEARVRVRLVNPQSRLATGALFVSDTVSQGLGDAPRFNVGSLRPRESRELTYRVRAARRGRFPVGPLQLGFRDPLGCVERTHQIGGTMSLVVTPAVVDLASAGTRGTSSDGGPSHTRRVSSAGEDDTVPREYRRGDELRRIHWRSTARHGKPMVRREEQQWQEHCTVLLDVRATAHAGNGADSSLETAVAVAASIGRRALGDGMVLRLLTTERDLSTDQRSDVLLESLAVLRTSRATSLGGGIDRLQRAPQGRGGLTVAVLGALRAHEAEALAKSQLTSGRRVAVLGARAAWSSPADTQGATATLRQGGWEVIAPSSLDELPELWRQTAQAAAVTASDDARAAIATTRPTGVEPS
jgi:uncharacterized protein (DUF58 family)